MGDMTGLVQFSDLAVGDLFILPEFPNVVFQKTPLETGFPPRNSWNVTMKAGDYMPDDKPVKRIDKASSLGTDAMQA